MTEKQMKSGLRHSHRWVGGVAAIFLLVAGITGFLLQHPSWLGPIPNPPASLAVDPTDPGRLLRGTHWGVDESRDDGQTWREINMLVPPTDVARIVFSPDNPLVVFALGRDALVRSDDGGRIWRDISVAAAGLEPGTVFLDLGVGAGGLLRLLTDRGLVASSDGGLTWTGEGLLKGDSSTNLRTLIHDLHTGHILGSAGRRLTEFGALAMLFITVTGLVLLRRNGKVFRK